MIYNVGGVWAMQTRTYVNEKVYILKKYGGGVGGGGLIIYIVDVEYL